MNLQQAALLPHPVHDPALQPPALPVPLQGLHPPRLQGLLALGIDTVGVEDI